MSLLAFMLMIGSGEPQTRKESSETEGVLWCSDSPRTISARRSRESKVVSKFGAKVKPVSEELVTAVEKALQ